jgi:hypothetical protein
MHGTVALFRAEVPIDLWNAVVDVDPLLGWQQMTTGRVERHSVSKGHLEVFHPDNIDKLARQMAESIGHVSPAAAANR